MREVAAAGVYVSAHPDVILKMGTKEVLYDTRDLGWGVDTELYRTAADFRARFPAKLARAGPRVLKQYRGNGGQGVWKVELLSNAGASPAPSAPARILHALRGSSPKDVLLGEFMDRYASDYLVGGVHEDARVRWTGKGIQDDDEQRVRDELRQLDRSVDEISQQP